MLIMLCSSQSGMSVAEFQELFHSLHQLSAVENKEKNLYCTVLQVGIMYILKIYGNYSAKRKCYTEDMVQPRDNKDGYVPSS